MPTQQLVEQVKSHRLYKEYGTPDYDKILFALGKVDRRDFLDDELIELAATDAGAMKSLHESRMKLTGKGFIKTVAGFYRYDMLGKMDGVLGTTSIIQAQAKDLAYCDIALPIGYYQTCSQPSMVAFMLYLLELKEGQNVLEIGSGCGYHAAVCLGAIGNSGILTTIEIIPELAAKTRNNLKQHLGQNDLERRVRAVEGDGSAGFWGKDGFDRIYFTAAVNPETFNPEDHLNQLRDNGILLFPNVDGVIVKLTKKPGGVKAKDYKIRCSFVPLVGQNS